MRVMTVLYGVVVSPPVVRDANGVLWTELDIRSRSVEGAVTSVTVVHTEAAAGNSAPAQLGDTVLVLGTTRRRFFRTGGATVSRTEVEAAQVLVNPDRRRRRRLVDAAVAAIEEMVA